MVRAQQKPVLHTGMAARRVGNRGEPKLRLVSPETLAPQQNPKVNFLGSVKRVRCRLKRIQFLLECGKCIFRSGMVAYRLPDAASILHAGDLPTRWSATGGGICYRKYALYARG